MVYQIEACEMIWVMFRFILGDS